MIDLHSPSRKKKSTGSRALFLPCRCEGSNRRDTPSFHRPCSLKIQGHHMCQSDVRGAENVAVVNGGTDRVQIDAWNFTVLQQSGLLNMSDCKCSRHVVTAAHLCAGCGINSWHFEDLNGVRSSNQDTSVCTTLSFEHLSCTDSGPMSFQFRGPWERSHFCALH